MITSKQVQDACRGPITYSKIKILQVTTFVHVDISLITLVI